MPITHAKVSTKADEADTSLVLPSDWNDAHVLNDGIVNFGGMYPNNTGWQPSIRRLPALSSGGNPSYIINGDLKVLRSALASHIGSCVLSSGGMRADGSTADHALIEGNDADDWEENDWNWSLENILIGSGATLAGTESGTFTLDESVTAAPSGATARVIAQGTGVLNLSRVVGTFAIGDTVTGDSSGETFTVASVTSQASATERSKGILRLARNYAPAENWEIFIDPNTETFGFTGINLALHQDSGDYAADWSGYTPPTGANGMTLQAWNSNAGVLAGRIYSYCGGGWHYMGLT